MERIKIVVSSSELLKTLLRIHYPTHMGKYEFTISASEYVMCCFFPKNGNKIPPFGFNVKIVHTVVCETGYYSMHYDKFNKLISILSMVNDQPITLVLDAAVGVYLEF